MSEPVNPKKSGYSELDGLIDKLFSEILTEDMNNYAKVWTCYLYLVDKITYNRGMDANTGAYSSSDVNTTPKEVLWATDLLNSGQGCCYNYSAAFMFIMRALGYDAHLVTGNVPSYGGGVTPHCWLYVNLNGTRYSFDPDLDMNFYKRGENEEKSIWFGRRLDDLGYFYKAETYHEI
ncbi:transglutaminase-like domain-containing protein [Eshraghiella crossota]